MDLFFLGMDHASSVYTPRSKGGYLDRTRMFRLRSPLAMCGRPIMAKDGRRKGGARASG